MIRAYDDEGYGPEREQEGKNAIKDNNNRGFTASLPRPIQVIVFQPNHHKPSYAPFLPLSAPSRRRFAYHVILNLRQLLVIQRPHTPHSVSFGHFGIRKGCDDAWRGCEKMDQGENPNEK